MCYVNDMNRRRRGRNPELFAQAPVTLTDIQLHHSVRTMQFAFRVTAWCATVQFAPGKSGRGIETEQYNVQ